MIRTILRICLTLMALLASATASFALPNCPSDQTKRYHNCFGPYTFPGGDKYVGEWQDDKQNGQGTYTFANGAKYVGEYKDNKRNGHFEVTYADGATYVGEVKDNKKSGQGTYTWPNGDKYVGEFKDGKKNGQGTATYTSGNKYVGEFKDDKKNGQGFYIWKNGKADFCVYVDDEDSNCSGSNVYDVAPTLTEKFRQLSEFQRRKIQSNLKSMDLYSSTIDGKWGRGTFSGLASYAVLNLKTVTINNSSTANMLFQKIAGSSSPSAGTCPSDQTKRYHNCFGTHVFGPDSEWAGDKYVGEWQDNKQNGQGSYTFANGDKYIGEWKDGKSNGQGTYTFADGNKYVGEYKDNKRNGQGIFTFGSTTEWAGDKHIGEYKDDKRNGQGTYTYANGDKYVGEYKGNEANGQGTATFANGDKYVGEFINGSFNGQGTFTYADGTVEEGIWNENEFQYAQSSPETLQPACKGSHSTKWTRCIGTYTLEDGTKYVGDFINGDFNGQGTTTFASGNKHVGEYKDDKRNGQGIYTYANGNKYVGEYKDDKRNGQGTSTFADGDKYVGGWTDGKKNGQGTYTFADGNKYAGEYKDGKRHGQGTYTFTDGRIEEGIWKDGEFLSAQSSPEVVETDDPNETREVASGTGFYVSHEGHIITNYHVIDGCMDVKVHTEGRVMPTLQIADDKQNDLALLKISETPSHVFALSNDSPFPLQEIVVAGFPFGESYSSSLKFTQGIVSSLTGIGNNYSEMQIDAALQPGNSGGPIIDEYGNIVGVAVAKLDAKYTFDNFGVIPENTNFGIKASAAKNLLEGNQVPLKTPNTDLISRRDISRLATDGTVYLTCWMTSAQLELMKSKKVTFGNLD